MDLKKSIAEEIESLVSFYKVLHANPELSHKEIHSSGMLADYLEECGITVTRNFCGTGVIGVLENGAGPTLAIRTDLDALPITENSGVDYASSVTCKDDKGNTVGVMHACGHDIHMTSFAGTAKILSQNMDRWSGRILFIGQPAEESMSGARDLIESGLFEKFAKPDCCLATHVFPKLEVGKIAVRSGPAMAGTYQLKITVRGVGGHGALPQESRDPVVLAARIITSLQTIVSREFSPVVPAVVTVGSIHGGTRANIIPGEVVMEVTARFFDKPGRNKIYESIKRICRQEALSMDIPEDLLPVVDIDTEGELPAVINDESLAQAVREAAIAHLGKQHCVEAEMVMGSEDFALFRNAAPDEIPCCLFFTGATSAEDMERYRQDGINPPSLHNCRFCPPPEETITTAVTVMSATVLNLFDR